MIKLENAGLRAQRKMSLGSGLHGQKRIRAPVSKMVGLRAPQQKFQGSRAPGTPPLGPWLFLLWKFGGKNFCDLPKDTNFKFAVQQAIDTIIFFKNKPRTFEKQHCEKGQDLAHISHQFGSNIKCDIENIELSPRKIVMLQSVYCWLEMWKNVWQVFLTLLSFM